MLIGVPKKIKNNPHLLNGLTIFKEKITYKTVAEALQKPFVAAMQVFKCYRPHWQIDKRKTRCSFVL